MMIIKPIIAILLVLYTEWLAKQYNEINAMLPEVKDIDYATYLKGKQTLRQGLKQRIKLRRFLRKMREFKTAA